MRLKYNTSLDVYTLPGDVWHVSTSNSLENNYYETLVNVVEKYQMASYLRMTTGNWPASVPYVQTVSKISNALNSVPKTDILKPAGSILWSGVVPLLWEHTIVGLSAVPYEALEIMYGKMSIKQSPNWYPLSG